MSFCVNNSSCYQKETLTYPQGALEGAVDMAYLITLTNSNRQWKEELEKFSLNSKVTVVYNQGYENCKKILPKQQTVYDLVDAVAFIFRDALKQNYQRILVLEDDFVVINQELSNFTSVSNFVCKRSPDIYHLGPHMQLSWYPPFAKHNRYITFSTTHAVIYSSKYMLAFVEASVVGNIHATDGPFWSKLVFSKYAYCRPLIAQILHMTANREHWRDDLSDWWISLWKLDKSCDHYQSHHDLLRWLPWCFLFLVLLLTITVVVVTRRRKSRF